MHLTLSPGRTARKAAHARTASQPFHHHHPELARLDGGVRELRSWTASSGGGVADGSSGLALVDSVLAALGEVLELPQAAAAACDRVLDGFLVLADAYGTFESALLALRESVAEARCGARRGDGATVAASLRARRRTEKELCRLAGAMRQASRTPAAEATGNDVGDAVAEAAAATAAASEAIFLGCAAMSLDMSSSMASSPPSKNWLARLHVVPASKKVSPETATAAAAAAATALERMEECIGELESGSEKVFRRLLQTRVSLLNIHNPLPARTAAAAAARSASLPREHWHPVLARLDGGIRALRSWSAAAARFSGVDGDGRCDGLALVEDVLAVLGEMLELPQAAAAIHRAGVDCERALDGFLVLADAFGTFESVVLALRQSAAELRAGARRGDGATVAAALRAHRRAERELCRLAAAMRQAVRRTPAAAAAARPASDADGEVVGVVTEAAAVTAAASEAIFLRCVAMSRDVPAMVQTAASHKWLTRLGVKLVAKKAASPEMAPSPALERLEELEECISEMESGSEKVFRRLLQTRVSLLNIHNPL
uniref:DUF241 domain-containing protein n=1 Tax=Oryza punctata TaxID=4537 RepID=A0A0E0M9L2_ORYPU